MTTMIVQAATTITADIIITEAMAHTVAGMEAVLAAVTAAACSTMASSASCYSR